MALSITVILLSLLVALPLSAFVIVMLALSSMKLAAVEIGGTKDENNLWNQSINRRRFI